MMRFASFFLLGLVIFLIFIMSSSALSLPLPPSHLEAEIISPTHVRLTWWDNSTDEDGFLIERRTPSGNWQQIGYTPPDVNVYNDEGLSPGETYYYRVRAYQGGYYTSYCELSEPVTTIGFPEPPANLSGKALSSSEIELSWEDKSDNELGFIVERKWGNNWIEVDVLPPDTESFIDTDLSEYTKYTYRVLAFNEAGRTSSKEIEVRTKPSGGEVVLSAGCTVGAGSFSVFLLAPVFVLAFISLKRGDKE